VLERDLYERYMDRYSIEDSIRMGPPSPSTNEVRLTDWTVALCELDQKFEALFADRSPEERKALMGEAKLDAILKHPQRIAQVSEDLARHFVEHIRPNGFKAMVVCRDQRDVRPLQGGAGSGCWLRKVSLIIISEDPIHDVAMIRPHYLGEAATPQGH